METTMSRLVSFAISLVINSLNHVVAVAPMKHKNRNFKNQLPAARTTATGPAPLVAWRRSQAFGSSRARPTFPARRGREIIRRDFVSRAEMDFCQVTQGGCPLFRHQFSGALLYACRDSALQFQAELAALSLQPVDKPLARQN